MGKAVALVLVATVAVFLLLLYAMFFCFRIADDYLRVALELVETAETPRDVVKYIHNLWMSMVYLAASFASFFASLLAVSLGLRLADYVSKHSRD